MAPLRRQSVSGKRQGRDMQNMPDEMKAEKNAKRREDYRHRQAAKQTSNTTEQSGN